MWFPRHVQRMIDDYAWEPHQNDLDENLLVEYECRPDHIDFFDASIWWMHDYSHYIDYDEFWSLYDG